MLRLKSAPLLDLPWFQHALEPTAASVAPKVRHRLLRALRSFARLSDEVPDSGQGLGLG